MDAEKLEPGEVTTKEWKKKKERKLPSQEGRGNGNLGVSILCKEGIGEMGP